MGYGAEIAIEMAITAMVAEAERNYDLLHGLHQTRDGTKIKISEMTTRHLVNTINYFKIPNGSRYHKELEKRNITNNS